MIRTHLNVILGMLVLIFERMERKQNLYNGNNKLYLEGFHLKVHPQSCLEVIQKQKNQGMTVPFAREPRHDCALGKGHELS